MRSDRTSLTSRRLVSAPRTVRTLARRTPLDRNSMNEAKQVAICRRLKRRRLVAELRRLEPHGLS
jgi:hypothetical protein